MNKIGTMMVLLLFVTAIGKAQDVFFTNYLNTPLYTNPALVAFDTDFKIGLDYRGRTSKFSQEYNTPVLSMVYPMMNQEKSKEWGGIGFSILSDMSNNANMIKTTGGSFAFAYKFQINKTQEISASLGAGYFRREINLNNLTTGSQYIPNQGYDPSLPTNELFTNKSKGYLDLSTGMVWQVKNNQGGTKLFVGFSAFHVNQPNISMTDTEDALPIRYGFQTGVLVLNMAKLQIFPDAGFDYQAGLFRYNVGTRLSVPFKDATQKYMQSAIISISPRYISDNLASIGFEFQKPNYNISISYDFCVANRKVNPNLTNAYEICISYKKSLFSPQKQKEKIIVDENYVVGSDRHFNTKINEETTKEKTVIKDSSTTVETKLPKILTNKEQKITFNYKSNKVEEEAKKLLDEIVILMKANEGYALEIEGHTDNTGNAENNKQYSYRRAKAIQNYLVSQGILPSRIIVSGRGASKPIATNATEEGRAKNRRVEFRLYKIIN